MDPLVDYLKGGKLPEDTAKAQKVKCLVPCFVLINNKLYKRSYSWPLLKCLHPSETDYALHEVHEGICSNHLDDRELAYKVLR